MLNSTRGLRVIVLCAILLGIVASLQSVKGQDKTTGGIRISSVDIQRLQDEYVVFQTFKKEFDAKKEALQTQLQCWAQNRLLNAADQQTLGDLAVKDKSPAGLTGAEKSTQQKLMEMSKKLQDDFHRLQSTQVGNITAQDQTTLNEYVKLDNDTEIRAKNVQDKFTSDMQVKLKDTAAEAQKAMKEALDKIAKAKGYSVIFSAEVAPYSEFDCTDEVLKMLNKK